MSKHKTTSQASIDAMGTLDRPALEPAGAAPTMPSNGELINILIVDDEPRNLTVLETVLEDPGYRLVRAESAEQALLALVAEEFALLVLDIQMPGMSGFELAQMIKQRKKTAGVPIIFLTAYYSEDQHVLEGYGTGAVDYLHKPINPAILRSKVAVFAELYRKSRESERANRALSSEVAARRLAEDQLRQLNEELEHRVADRTAELLQANAALSESESRLRLALRAGRTGVWDWDFATDRVIWSGETYAIHAMPPGSFGGTIDAFKQLVHEEDRPRVLEAIRAAIARNDTYSCEFRIVRPDGATRWVTALGLIQTDATGQGVSMTGTVTDITERRAAEQALRQREREMRSLADNTPDILTRFDRNLRYVFANAAIEKATGQPPRGFLGRTIREVGMPGELCESLGAGPPVRDRDEATPVHRIRPSRPRRRSPLRHPPRARVRPVGRRRIGPRRDPGRDRPEVRRGGVERCRQAQGRIPGHPRPRASEPARTHPDRPPRARLDSRTRPLPSGAGR